jgi:hypothetical protein
VNLFNAALVSINALKKASRANVVFM